MDVPSLSEPLLLLLLEAAFCSLRAANFQDARWIALARRRSSCCTSFSKELRRHLRSSGSGDWNAFCSRQRRVTSLCSPSSKGGRCQFGSCQYPWRHGWPEAGLPTTSKFTPVLEIVSWKTWLNKAMPLGADSHSTDSQQ